MTPADEQKYQLIVYAGDEIRTLDLPGRGVITIGRGEGSDVRIDDPSVSRNHAVLKLGPPLAIEDLSSANGTMVRDRAGGAAAAAAAAATLNVRRLKGCGAELAVGETILFGTTAVLVRHPPVTEVPSLEVGAGGVLVRDPVMHALYETAARAARSPISVLVLGETGVGKESLARAVHAHSPRAKGPFLAIDCSTLNSESLADDKLFGHEKGAFTGALATTPGVLEAASGGTVFLDEVGNLSLDTQAKLLRVMDQREVTRIGSNRPRPVDVRIVSATNRDIDADSKSGSFRSDLFFRLNGVSLSIPPLRARPLEIEPIAQMFITAACSQIERAKPPTLSPAAIALLHRYEWPGNVRELRNAIERAVALCMGDTIQPGDLPPGLLEATGSRPARGAVRPEPPPEAREGTSDLASDIRALERARIVDMLDRCGGSQTQAAKRLGISRGTLIARMEAFNLPRPRKRDDDASVE